MNKSKLIALSGILVLALVLAYFYKSDFRSDKNGKKFTTSKTETTQMMKPDGSVDTTVKAFTSYSEDASVSYNDNDSTNASVIDAEVSGAYSEQYENNGL